MKPGVPDDDALQLTYETGNEWKAMQPDFIFFSRRQDALLGAAIAEPHGDHLAVALPKLKGLAWIAEKCDEWFVRIEAVSMVGDVLRMLDLTKSIVHAAIAATTSASDLYRSN